MIKRKELKIGDIVYADTSDIFFLPTSVKAEVIKLDKKNEFLPVVLKVVLKDNTIYNIKRTPNQLFREEL